MKYLKYLPVILWMVLIFFLSGRSDLPKADSFFWEFLIKKSGHVFVYTILTLLWIVTLVKNKVTNAVLFSFAYAFTDEIHQIFVPTRTGMLRDVYIDLIGIALAVLLFNIFNLWKNSFSLAPSKRLKKQLQT